MGKSDNQQRSQHDTRVKYCNVYVLFNMKAWNSF